MTGAAPPSAALSPSAVPTASELHEPAGPPRGRIPECAARKHSGAPLTAAGLGRRLACFVYEGVLLFGVVMGTGLVYGIAAGQHNAMLGRHGLQVVLFVVLGAYFTWFWSHGGQTVAMKTWRLRLVRADGAPATIARCALRYLLAWLWFAPALVSLWLAGAAGSWAVSAVLALGVIGYALLALLHPDRQFWHDAVCGTRLVNWHPPSGATRPAEP